MAVVERSLGTVVANTLVQLSARVQGTLESANFKEIAIVIAQIVDSFPSCQFPFFMLCFYFLGPATKLDLVILLSQYFQQLGKRFLRHTSA